MRRPCNAFPPWPIVGGGTTELCPAGLAYFVLVLAAAFALGTLRVLVLEPHLGKTTAVCSGRR